MKNVRLFTVAAALGMFASTVTAAEPTKTVTWSDVDSVIKVDLGDKLIVKAPTATVTSSEEKVQVGSVYAVNYKANEESNWLYNDAFNWSNPDDAMKLLGLNGYRFVAPGSAAVKEEVFVDQASGTVYNNIEEMFAALVEKQYVKVEKTTEGDVKYIDIVYSCSFFDRYKDSMRPETITYVRLTANGRRSEDHMMEDVVDFVVNHKPLSTSGSNYSAKFITIGTGNYESSYNTITIYEQGRELDTDFHITLGEDDIENLISYGLVVAVDSKKGEYYWNQLPLTSRDASQVVTTESKWEYTAKKLDANGQPVSGTAADKFTAAEFDALEEDDTVYFADYQDAGTEVKFAPAGTALADLTADDAGVLLTGAGTAASPYVAAANAAEAKTLEAAKKYFSATENKVDTGANFSANGTYVELATTTASDYAKQVKNPQVLLTSGTNNYFKVGANTLVSATGTATDFGYSYREVLATTPVASTHYTTSADYSGNVYLADGVKYIDVTASAGAKAAPITGDGTKAKGADGKNYSTYETATTSDYVDAGGKIYAVSGVTLYVTDDAGATFKKVSDGDTLVTVDANNYYVKVKATTKAIIKSMYTATEGNVLLVTNNGVTKCSADGDIAVDAGNDTVKLAGAVVTPHYEQFVITSNGFVADHASADDEAITAGETLLDQTDTIYKAVKTVTKSAIVNKDTFTAVWNGEEAVAATDVYKNQKTYSATTELNAKANVKDLKTAKDYVIGETGIVAFTAGDVRWLDEGSTSADIAASMTAAASKTNSVSRDFGVISDEYETVDLRTSHAGQGKALDAIAYITIDELGYTTRHIAKVSDGNVYYQLQPGETSGTLVAGDMVKITKANEDTYFNGDCINHIFVDGINVTATASNEDAVFPQSRQTKYAFIQGYAGLESIDNTYDYIKKGVGYKTSAKNNAKRFTFGGLTYPVEGTDCYEASKYENTAYNQLTKLGKAGYITFVDISDADVTNETWSKSYVQRYQGASLITRFEIPGDEDYLLENNYKITLGDEIELSTTSNVASERTYTNETLPGSYGIYEIEGLPANNTDKYVIVYNNYDSVKGEWETHTGLDLSKVWSYSESKGTGSLDTLDGKEIECAAVQLERRGDFYPAFNTLEELYTAVKAVTGLDTALVGSATDKTYGINSEKKASTFKAWYDKNMVNGDAKLGVVATSMFNDVNFASLQANMPTEAEVKETKVVDSTSTEVTITSNLADIDTTVAGVKTLTYSATYNGEVVDTKDVTVVVAPTYKRTWKNGRVATLTSYYVSDPTAKYAFYEYDWTAKKATVTFYNLDGSVAETTSIAL